MPQKYTFFDSVLGFEKFLFNKFLIVGDLNDMTMEHDFGESLRL